MRFRPCIDIHNGKVKQIVGGSLSDEGNQAVENFVAEQDASFYASLYKEHGLNGGHIILLNAMGSEYYEADVEQAFKALKCYPQGLQIGGGINDENAARFLAAGASHVIVTSFVFQNGTIHYDHLKRLVNTVTSKHIVLDLSCRRKEDGYYIVTDRWQKFTNVKVSVEVLNELSEYCDEFLIHAVDVEGKASGIETELVEILSQYNGHPVTYAGGVGSLKDIDCLKQLSAGKIDVTVGSALDLFGGTIPFKKLLNL